MIDLSKPPEDQELQERYISKIVDDICDFIKKEEVNSIDYEMNRLIANSRIVVNKRWHNKYPDPNVFDRYLGKICDTPIEILPEIIAVMFENICFIPQPLSKEIVHVLNKNEYEYVNRCRTCYHFRNDGCYLKGYKQVKNPQDFCSSHSSCTHSFDNQPVF